MLQILTVQTCDFTSSCQTLPDFKAKDPYCTTPDTVHGSNYPICLAKMYHPDVEKMRVFNAEVEKWNTEYTLNMAHLSTSSIKNVDAQVNGINEDHEIEMLSLSKSIQKHCRYKFPIGILKNLRLSYLGECCHPALSKTSR